MSLFLNELSFLGIHDDFELIHALEVYYSTVKRLSEKYEIRLVDILLYVSESEIADIYSWVIKIQDRDKKRILLSQLSNYLSTCTEECIQWKDKKAVGASYAKSNNGVLISFPYHVSFRDAYLCFTDAQNQGTGVRNIGCAEHIELHGEYVIVRTYVGSPKHGINEYYRAGGKYVSSMDLDDSEAQAVLNKAVYVDGKLYGVYNGCFYQFFCTLRNEYHGYKNTMLSKDLQNKIMNSINQRLNI